MSGAPAGRPSALAVSAPRAGGDFVDCSRNEFLFPHPVLAAGRSPRLRADQICGYRTESALLGGLAGHLGLDPDLLRLYNGAEHALHDAFAGVARMPDATLLMPTPSWEYYGVLAAQAGVRTRTYRYRVLGNEYALDLDALMGDIVRTPRPVVLLASPSNPLGSEVANPVHRRIAEELARRGGYLITDQTYDGYSAGRPRPLADRLGDLPNCLVVRSLSKYYGIPALRVGFTAADPAVHRAFRMHGRYLGFNAFAESFALECLGLHPAFADAAAEIVGLRETLSRRLAAFDGLTVYASEANFILVRVRDGGYAQWLLQRGVKVRAFPSGPLDDCVRITIPPEPVVARILEATEEFFTAGPGAGGR